MIQIVEEWRNPHPEVEQQWPIFIPKRKNWGGYKSPVDIERIVNLLQLDEPERLAKFQIIDLWNQFTDYYLPRYCDRGRPLRPMLGGMNDPKR